MEKWLILALEQEIDKMNLNHAVVTEKEELAQKKKNCIMMYMSKEYFFF